MIPLAERIGFALISYLAACATAAICYTLLVIVSVQVVGVEHPSELSVGQQTSQVVWFTVLVGLFVLCLSFLPSVAALAVLSLLKLRHVVWHIAAGILVAAAAVMLAVRYVPLMDRMQFDWVMALCGAAGGAAFSAMNRKLVGIPY